VVDEFGSTAGVITIEDILGQLVGEVQDEFDTAEPQPALAAGEAALVVDGSTSLRDLEMDYQITLPRDAGFETLAGFMLSRLQKIPHIGDQFEFEARRFAVKEMDGHRIASVKIDLVKSAAMQQAGD
jgi:CBS domain containing-hemolysin-like protein